MPNTQAKELTKKYQDGRLPEGWYYFSCGGTREFIGKFTKPTLALIKYAAEQGEPLPQQIIHSCPGRFIGALRTITVLAPVPAYNKEQPNANAC